MRVVPLRRCSIGVYALLLHGLVAAARALGNRLAELLLEVVLDVVVVPVVLPQLVSAGGTSGEGIGHGAGLLGWVRQHGSYMVVMQKDDEEEEGRANGSTRRVLYG